MYNCLMKPLATGNHPYTSSMTGKGQVTIPVHIRRLLGLSRKDRVAFLVREEGIVQIAPATSVVAQTAGMLRHEGVALSLRAEKAAAEEAMAEEAEHSRRD